MKQLLSIKNISKTYRTNAGEQIHALKNLSLSIPENKLTILIGETGCGKTTLLNIIAGLDKNFSGEINFSSNPTHPLNISYVFQQYTLFPWRNIINNVAFSLEMQGVSKSKRYDRAEELLKKVGLTGFEKSYPHELSGGMRQRAAIAQALAKKTDLLLLDEPFGALDDATRREIQQTFLQVMETENFTAILVTHNIEEALLLGDHICIFSNRPSQISAIHDIQSPHPREQLAEDFVELFTELRRTIQNNKTKKNLSH